MTLLRGRRRRLTSVRGGVFQLLLPRCFVVLRHTSRCSCLVLLSIDTAVCIDIAAATAAAQKRKVMKNDVIIDTRSWRWLGRPAWSRIDR